MANRHITLDPQTQHKECHTRVYKKKRITNSYIIKEMLLKLLTSQINCGGVTSTNTMGQVFFMLPHYFAGYIIFGVLLPKHSWILYGELSFGFPGEAVVLRPNILWSTSPHSNVHHYSQHQWYPQQCHGSFVSGRLVMVQIECCSHCTSHKKCRHNKMYRQMHRPTHKSKVPGWVSFCHAAKFQNLNGSWFIIFLELYFSGAGTSSLAWSPSFVECRLVN